MEAPELWSHQREAVEWLRSRSFGMLAMEMGSGKTRVAIEAFRGLLESGGRVLVLTPKSVIASWLREIERCGITAVAPGSQGTAQRKAQEISRALDGRAQVGVLNLELAIQPAMRAALLARAWACTVVDESHRIKAPGGKASILCRSLRDRSRLRLCLTGTPMPHSPLDVYAQFRFLSAMVFGESFVRFRSEYARMVTIDNGVGVRFQKIVGFQNLDRLQAVMAPHTRVVKIDEVMDLPGQIFERRIVSLEPEVMRVYRQVQRDMVAEIDAGIIRASNCLSRVIRLQQVANGIAAMESDDGLTKHTRIGNAKLDALTDLIDDLPEDEPVVVFFQFLADIDAFKIDSAPGRVRELSGRVNELAEWQSGQGRILACQIQAGAVGIDLTRARYCIYYSLGYSLGNYVQSLARCHRPGQTRRVVYTQILAEGTIDFAVAAALEAKTDVVEAVIAGVQAEAKCNAEW